MADKHAKGQASASADGDPTKTFENWPNARDLPALSSVASHIIQISSRDPFDRDECIRFFASDAGLAAKLLKLVNSSYYGLRGTITSVDLAARMLGEVAFRCLALGLAVAGSLPRPKIEPFNPDLFWRDNLVRALFAREMADEHQAPHASESFSSALLQNMAVPILLQMISDDYSVVLDRFELGREPLFELENLRYGWNHCTFGSWVAERWRFPAAMVLSIRHHHDSLEPYSLAMPALDPASDSRLVRWVQLSALLPSSAVDSTARWKKCFNALRAAAPTVSLRDVATRVDEAFAALVGLFQEETSTIVRLAERYDASI